MQDWLKYVSSWIKSISLIFCSESLIESEYLSVYCVAINAILTDSRKEPEYDYDEEVEVSDSTVKENCARIKVLKIL